MHHLSVHCLCIGVALTCVLVQERIEPNLKRRVQYINDPATFLKTLCPHTMTENMATLTSLRKVYKRTIASLHPDKTSRLSADKRVEAEVIYKLLMTKYEEFKN